MAEQALWLQQLRGFKTSIRKGQLTAVGTVQPLPLCAGYKIRIDYEFGRRPRVKVLDPPLQRRDGQRAEHLYADHEPCVYLPRSGEWTQHKLLTETIVPWVMLWLAFYELWLVTGEWKGGGLHPASAKPEPTNDRA